MTELKPGRYLDALVAEKVMGDFEKDLPPMPRGLYHDPLIHGPRWPKPYSTDIAAAWEVVEKLWSSPHNLECQITMDKGNGVSATFNIDDGPIVGACYDSSETHYTVPEAICLAALKAVGS